MTVPITLLLVEDDAGHARLIDKNLRRAGISNPIRAFSDGTSIMEAVDSPGFAEGGPYLILLDLNLPDMSGADILATIKDNPRTKHIPVIVLTTTDDRGEMKRCYELGCSVYITKPVDYDAFANAIRQLGMFLSVIQVP
jgi:CheY-like chemotaxis protein